MTVDKSERLSEILPFDSDMSEEILRNVSGGGVKCSKKVALKLLGIDCESFNIDKASLTVEELNLLEENKRSAIALVNENTASASLAEKLIKQINSVITKSSPNALSQQKLNGYDFQLEKLACALTAFIQLSLNESRLRDVNNYSSAMESVLLYTCAFSGLCFKEALLAMSEKLSTEDKPLYKLGNSFFIDIEYSKSGHMTNHVGLNERVSLRRLYLEPFSASSVNKALRFKNKETDVAAANKVGPSALRSLKKKIDDHLGYSDESIKNILKALFIAGQRLGKTPTPYYLQAYAFGDIYSASASLESLAAHHEKKIPKNIDFDFSIERTEISFARLQADSVSYNQDYSILQSMKEVCAEELATQSSQSREKTLLDLQQLRVKYEFNAQTEILFEWICSGLKRQTKSGKFHWEEGKGTANRYLSAIGVAWLNYWRNNNILECTDDEMDIFFEELCLSRENEDKTARDTLTRLFIYIGETYEVAIPTIIKESSGVLGHVRSQLIPESYYEWLRADIRQYYQKKEKTEFFLQALDVMLILLRRCFFRPSELYKLTLADIDYSSDISLHIRKNRFGGIKTSSANRIFPITLLLKPDEREIVEKFLYERRLSSKGKGRMLIFSQFPVTEVRFNDTIVNAVAIEMLSQYSDERLVFYQFRHSGISYLQLILFASIETATFFTGLDEIHIQKLKSMLIAREPDQLYELSGLAGHLSPKTTLSTYAHFTDVILYESLKNNEMSLDIKGWSSFSGISELRIRNFLSKNDLLLDKISATGIECLIYKSLDKFSNPLMKKRSKNKSVIDAQEQLFRPDLSCLQQVLSLLDNQLSATEIAEDFNLPLDYVVACKNATKKIKSAHVTSKGKSRLYLESQEDLLSPIHLKDPDEREEALSLAHSLLNENKNLNSRKKLDAFLNYVLGNVERSHNYIQFTDANYLNRFITFMSASSISKSKWHCVAELHENESRLSSEISTLQSLFSHHNFEFSSKTVKNSNKFKHGRFKLYFSHINEESKIDTANNARRASYLKGNIENYNGTISRYSSKSFVSACHLLLIFLKSEEYVG